MSSNSLSHFNAYEPIGFHVSLIFGMKTKMRRNILYDLHLYATHKITAQVL